MADDDDDDNEKICLHRLQLGWRLKPPQWVWFVCHVQIAEVEVRIGRTDFIIELATYYDLIHRT